MKYQSRKSVFETNSSSTHSLTISKGHISDSSFSFADYKGKVLTFDTFGKFNSILDRLHNTCSNNPEDKFILLLSLTSWELDVCSWNYDNEGKNIIDKIFNVENFTDKENVDQFNMFKEYVLVKALAGAVKDLYNVDIEFTNKPSYRFPFYDYLFDDDEHPIFYFEDLVKLTGKGDEVDFDKFDSNNPSLEDFGYDFWKDVFSKFITDKELYFNSAVNEY